MGEIADMIINGLLCQGCGSYIDDYEEPGYPRVCEDCGKFETSIKKLVLSKARRETRR